MIKAQTLKGFRDFLPQDAMKRQFVIGKMKEVFERFGFDPLETPALEYAETLLGKYGDEADKLLYLFEDRGGRKVGLKYDQTVPLARVIAQYGNKLPLPFKRYQIQPVWRAENPQKGRYREFLQCDIDVVGTSSLAADAEIIACVLSTVQKLGLKNIILFINDRSVFQNIEPRYTSAIDKLEKIGREGVIAELIQKGLSQDSAQEMLKKIEQTEIPASINKMFDYLKPQLTKELQIEYRPTLARGLDYYTGIICELVIQGEGGGSIGGGGRYDQLIGQFTGKDVPAVGFAFGFDRLVEAMQQFDLLPKGSTTTQALVTIFSADLLKNSLSLTRQLRDAGINTEVFYEATKLDKQLKYADRKGIPYVVIQGPDEATRGIVKLKDMRSQTQQELALEAVIAKIKKSSLRNYVKSSPTGNELT